MVSQVLTFKRDSKSKNKKSKSKSNDINRSILNRDDEDESVQLLKKTQKEAYFEENSNNIVGGSGKKKGPLAKLFKKKNTATKAEEEYVPPTPPTSPTSPTPPSSPDSTQTPELLEAPASPLNVTVVTGTKRHTPTGTRPVYPINDAQSTISELTYPLNTPNRRVGFDPSTKQTPTNANTPATRSLTPSSGLHSTSASSRAGVESEEDVDAPASTFCGARNEGGDAISSTMCYFDGICAPASATKAAPHVDESSVPSPSVSTSQGDKSTSRPVWGRIPSDDEDDDTFDTSAVDDSTYRSQDQTNSNSSGQHDSLGRRYTNGSSSPYSRSPNRTNGKAYRSEPQPMHENFEVILDASAMTTKKPPLSTPPTTPPKPETAAPPESQPEPQSPPRTPRQTPPQPVAAVKKPGPASKKRSWFSKKKANKAQEEEKKEEHVDNAGAVAATAMASSTESKSKAVSQFQSTQDKPEAESSKPKGSLAKRLSKAIKKASNKKAAATTTAAAAAASNKEENSGGAGRNKKSEENWRKSKSGSAQTMRIIKETDAPTKEKKSAEATSGAKSNSVPQDANDAGNDSEAKKPDNDNSKARAATGVAAAAAAGVAIAAASKTSSSQDDDATKEAKSQKPATTSTKNAATKAEAAEGNDKKQKTGRNKPWKALSRMKFMSKKRSKDDSDVKYGGATPSPAAAAAAPASKPLWKPVVDPNTDRTYYYHRKTRETTWIKPQELVDREAKIAEANGEKPKDAKQQDQKNVNDSARSARTLDAKETKRTGRTKTATPTKMRGERRAVSESPVPVARKASKKSIELRPDSAVEETKTDAEDNAATKEQEQSEVAKPATPTSTPAPTPTTTVTTTIMATSPSPPPQPEPVIAPSPVNKTDDMWEKKKEVTRLLDAIPASNRDKADDMMSNHPGEVEYQLQFLQDLLEAKPFDEPETDAPMDEPHFTFAASSLKASDPMNKRVITGFSRTSATTRSTVKTDKTDKIRNTWKGPRGGIETISEVQSTTTSITSGQQDEPVTPSSGLGLLNSNGRVPSRVPIVHRNRELKVEDLSDSRLLSETYERNGRVMRGRGMSEDGSGMDGSGFYNSEADTYGDSVSALSENENDYSGRRDNFEGARRRALEDAIEREDWELAAALTEGMRGTESTGDYTKAHGAWKQSAIDKFIAQNNWDAVSTYIARMRNKAKSPGPDSDELIMSPSANHTVRSPAPAATLGVVRAPSRTKKGAPNQQKQQQDDQGAPQPAASLEKRIGSRSQLQHREITSDSSWTSEDSYDTYDSEFT